VFFLFFLGGNRFLSPTHRPAEQKRSSDRQNYSRQTFKYFKVSTIAATAARSGAQADNLDFQAANRLMPRPSKRARTNRLETHTKMGKKLQREASEPLGPSPAGNVEECCSSDSEWSEAEEDLSFPSAQPAKGRKTAERGLPLVVRGAAGEVSFYTVLP